MTGFRSIKTWIALAVLVVGLALLGEDWMRAWRVKKEQEITSLEREAAATAMRLSGVMQHFFRNQLPRAAELEMSYAAVSPELSLGIVCDGRDQVMHATGLQWRDQPLAATPLASAEPVAAASRSTMEGVSRWDASRRRLQVAYPFFATFDPKDRGVVLLSYDSSLAIAQAWREVTREQLARACMVAAVCLGLWLVLDVLVTGRVRSILEQVGGAASGGPMRPALSGGDELAQISRSLTEAMAQVRGTESRLLEAGERERRRIGADLHDDVCQRIVAAQLKSGVLGSVLRGSGHEQAGLATEVAEELAKAAKVARGFARGLSPMLVQRGRLAEILRELAGTLSDSFMLRCEAECEMGDRPLALWVDGHIFRIAQELAVNAAKHAKPSWIGIAVNAAAGKLTVRVESDGTPPGRGGGGGIGLEMVRQRARALGGQFHLEAGAGGKGSIAWCEAALEPRHYEDETSGSRQQS